MPELFFCPERNFLCLARKSLPLTPLSSTGHGAVRTNFAPRTSPWNFRVPIILCIIDLIKQTRAASRLPFPHSYGSRAQSAFPGFVGPFLSLPGPSHWNNNQAIGNNIVAIGLSLTTLPECCWPFSLRLPHVSPSVAHSGFFFQSPFGLHKALFIRFPPEAATDRCLSLSCLKGLCETLAFWVGPLMMNLGAANESSRIAKHSDVALPNITIESLDDKQSARCWGHCPFPECKATTLCQLKWKAVQVVLAWFSNNPRQPGACWISQKLHKKSSWCSRLELSPEDSAIRSCVTWSRFTAEAAT